MSKTANSTKVKLKEVDVEVRVDSKIEGTLTGKKEEKIKEPENSVLVSEVEAEKIEGEVERAEVGVEKIEVEKGTEIKTEEVEVYQPEVLVLGPGAEKGYYELGVLRKLESTKSLEKVKFISCCSIGSIIGLLITVGYNIKEIILEVMQNDTFEVLGKINITNIFTKGGIFENTGLKSMLTRMVIKKLGRVPSMKSLYMSTGIELSISVTNLNTRKYEEIINQKTEPDISCVDAVLLSSALPFVFNRLEYRGDSIVDGALSNPYPIDLYDNGKRDILGIYIDERLFSKKITNNFEYFNHIIHCQIDILRNIKIKNSSKKCFHVGVTVSDKVKNLLMMI